MQLDLFDDEIVCEIKSLKESHDRVRRGLFARIDAQGKALLKLELRLQELERQKTRDIYDSEQYPLLRLA